LQQTISRLRAAFFWTAKLQKFTAKERKVYHEAHEEHEVFLLAKKIFKFFMPFMVHIMFGF